MKLIARYLRPFVILLLICIILLFGSAMSDLSLPNLMSSIVNTGIYQSGIESDVPEIISSQGMEFIGLFMSDSDRAEFKKAFDSSFDKTKISKEFPYANDKSALVLNPESKGDAPRLYNTAAMAALYYLKEMSAQNGGAGIEIDSETGVSVIDISMLYEFVPAISAMPFSAIEPSITAAGQANYDTCISIGKAFTQLFYKELGADMADIQQQYIIKKGLQMLAVALFGIICTITVGFFAARISSFVAQKIRRDVFAKVESFSKSEFDKFSTASLITRTTNDVSQVQMLIVMGIRMLCFAPIMGIGGTIFAINKSPSMSWTIAMAVIILMGLVALLFSVAMPKFTALQGLIDRLGLVSRENLSGLMVIRSFGNEQHEQDRFEKANYDLSKTNMFVQRVMSLTMPLMSFIMSGTTLLIVWVGAHAIANSTLQIGDMMAFMQYAMQIIMSFLMIAMMSIMFPRAAVSAKRIDEVLKTPLEITDRKNPKPFNNISGLVEFKNVSFRYQNAKEYVLKDISFVAKPGQTTAFIGSTGSGKSTLVNLIPRFYDVSEGSIEIDGRDVRTFSQHELRENIGYVPQKGILFSGDIKSNILYGKKDGTENEINTVLEISKAAEFVNSTEQGILLKIAKSGTNVSGGQRQRLSIARALIKRPLIYIFDDSFSALDFKTDAKLRKALEGYTDNATVLIVAQRIGTIMNADQIIVLDNGYMVGIGTHRELLHSCPTYKEIAESQLSKGELA